MGLKLLPPGTRKGNKTWLIRGMVRGRLYERSTEETEEAKARVKLRALELELEKEAAGIANPAAPTFGELATFYLNSERQPSKATRGFVEAMLPLIGNRPAADITTAELVTVANRLYRGRTNETKNRQVIVPAAAVLHYAAENNQIPWVRFRKLKERPPEARAVSAEVAQALIASAPQAPQRLLLTLLFYQGWRLGEARRLRWQDIDLGAGMLTYRITKTNQIARVPLHERVAELLRAVPEGERAGRVFPWGSNSGVYKWLRPLAKKLGVHFTPHMARHTFATKLANAGASYTEIMEVGGWQSEKSVWRYGRVSPDRMRAVLGKL